MDCYEEKGNVIYTFDELLSELNYIKDERQLEMIKKAYLTAYKLHHGVKRKSGEDYIVHPINVAYIAASYKLDYETICASLLHDVVEDTPMKIDEIAKLFGGNIAVLVDGVTKITDMHFTTKNEEQRADQNKILRGMCQDVRILFIKLADRLHNMRTLSSMPPKKQIIKANETYELFVPLAYKYGLYGLKEELEDISFYYRDKDNYNKVFELIEKNKEYFYDILNDMKNNIRPQLLENGITATVHESIKNIYGIYRRLSSGINLENIHDLLALKVIVKSIPECYLSLGTLHSMYNYIDGRFKDYIYSPKSNNYKSLHTCLFSGTDYIVQARIRTYEMNRYASSGIMTYYQDDYIDTNDEIKNKLCEDFRFFKELVDIFSTDINNDGTKLINEEFSNQIKIYIQNKDGQAIALPFGSSVIDVAFKLGDDVAYQMETAFVNNKKCSFGHKLQNGDIVKIVTNENKLSIKSGWVKLVKTNYAKEKIKTYTKKNNRHF